MKYTIGELANIAGVTKRTLRFYEQKRILVPEIRELNGYRGYSSKDADRLQLILLYRRTGMSLTDISRILNTEEIHKTSLLKQHLEHLKNQKHNIEKLINTVEQTILYYDKETVMSDKEKFEGLKEEMIATNEEKYGKEIRDKYGNAAVENSYKNIKNMSAEKMQRAEFLSSEIFRLLEEELSSDNPEPSSIKANQICTLHKEWLTIFWGKDHYNREAHMSLGDMYVEDERFREFYNSKVPNSAEFLRDSLKIYCS